MSLYRAEYEIAYAHLQEGSHRDAARAGRYILNNSNLPRYWQIQACILVAYATDDWEEAISYMGIAEDVYELLESEMRNCIHPEYHQPAMLKLRANLDKAQELQGKVGPCIDGEERGRWDEEELRPDDYSVINIPTISRQVIPIGRYGWEEEGEWSEEVKDLFAHMRKSGIETKYLDDAGALGPLYDPINVIRQSLVSAPSYARMLRQKEDAGQLKSSLELSKSVASPAPTSDKTGPAVHDPLPRLQSNFKTFKEDEAMEEAIEKAMKAGVFACEVERWPRDPAKDDEERVKAALKSERENLAQTEQMLKDQFAAQVSLLDKRKKEVDAELEQYEDE